MTHVVYSRHYDIRLGGLEKLHPFDSCKYGRGTPALRRTFGKSLPTASPRRPISTRELLQVHTAPYLGKLRDAAYLAEALEVPVVANVPPLLVRQAVLRPMRWACAGTLLAGELALRHGFAVNLSGGYHHAKPDQGEGFCVYADIALLVRHLRAGGAIGPHATIAYVDLDAHQGNGVCHCFRDDRSVVIFDMFGAWNYPAYDTEARDRVDVAVPLDAGTGDEEYLGHLRKQLPAYLDDLTRAGPVPLLIYNAGTDILAGDPLGGLGVSAEAIVERDRFVAGQARHRGIPFVMLLSGGYTEDSHAIIAASVTRLLREVGAELP